MDEKILTGIKTYSVKLTKLEESDKTILFEWINNKELVELNSFFKPISWDDHSKWFDNIKNKSDSKIFAIRGINDNNLIGTCQLHHINKQTKSAELQIRIGSFLNMGKGLGSQAVYLLLEYGFNNLQLERIFLNVFLNNERAIKSYLKNGFKVEGHLRRAGFVNNKFVDIKLMSILRDEFIE